MKNSLKLSLFVLLAMPSSGFGQQDQHLTFESLLTTAQQAQASSDYAAAATAYKQAVKIRPDIPELWANLGLMEHETSNYTAAIESFQRAHQLKPALYVPNLFLGIDFVHTGKAKEALPFLLTAEKINETDSQVHLALGRAYSSLQEFPLAAHEFSSATRLDPKLSSAWFLMGIAYLHQVEDDARKLSAQDHDSPYAKALFAESLMAQSRYMEAADLYKSALASNLQPPCIHGQLGFIYLKLHDISGAAREFGAGIHAEVCSLALLGQARLNIDADANDDGMKKIAKLWELDPGFVQSNAVTFAEGMSSERKLSFSTFLAQQHQAQEIPDRLYKMLTSTLEGTPQQTEGPATTHPASVTDSSEKSYAAGEYRQCASQAANSPKTKDQTSLRLLAACSFLTGDYELSSGAGAALARAFPQSSEALYWSIKADEKLAFQALERYEQLEPYSGRSHLLLGDIYIQRERYDDAQSEYQKALNIAPNDPAVLLGSASAYLRVNNIPKAIETSQLALHQLPDDPEVNLLVGEALMARHDFASAEPYLRKALHTKPQMLPHVHALLGRVFSETGRTQEAISELKLGARSDEDGSVHYQLARLYRQIGDTSDAAVAIEEMKAIQQRRREGAVIAFKDSHSSTLDDEP